MRGVSAEHPARCLPPRGCGRGSAPGGAPRIGVDAWQPAAACLRCGSGTLVMTSWRQGMVNVFILSPDPEGICTQRMTGHSPLRRLGGVRHGLHVDPVAVGDCDDFRRASEAGFGSCSRRAARPSVRPRGRLESLARGSTLATCAAHPCLWSIHGQRVRCGVGRIGAGCSTAVKSRKPDTERGPDTDLLAGRYALGGAIGQGGRRCTGRGPPAPPAGRRQAGVALQVLSRRATRALAGHEGGSRRRPVEQTAGRHRVRRGRGRGSIWLVMELVDAPSLAAVVAAQGPLAHGRRRHHRTWRAGRPPRCTQRGRGASRRETGQRPRHGRRPSQAHRLRRGPHP